MPDWKVLGQRVLFDSGYMRMDRRTCKSPSGYGEFDILRFNDQVIVIALTESQEVVLVDQFRHGSGRRTMEFPGGKCEPGEDSMNAAKRELSEETGFSSGNWTHLSSMAPNPAMQDNLVHVFLASDIIPGRDDPDLDEDIKVVMVSLKDIPAMLRDGTLGSLADNAAFFAFLASTTRDRSV